MIPATAAVPCTMPGQPHHLVPDGSDTAGRRIERCVYCDASFRMPAGGGSVPVLALDRMSTTVAPGITPLRFPPSAQVEP